MRLSRYLLALTIVLPLALASVPTADAQLGDRIRDRIRRDAERRIEERAVQAARRTLDLAEDAIVCAVTDEDCIEEARESGQEPVIVNEDGEPVSGYEPAGSNGNNSGNPSGGSDPGEVWANYEFIPGERVLFAHDFEGTRVGNFPSRIDYIAGNLDVVRLGSGEDANNVLRVGEDTGEGGRGGGGCFTLPLPETLPEQFTLEFRTLTTDPQRRARVQLFSDGSDDSPDTRCTYPPADHISVTPNEQALKWQGGGSAGEDAGFEANAWVSVALGCDGPYCKMYIDGTRVANVPRYEFPRASKIHVFMGVYRQSLYIDDLRIAEGGARNLYDDLEANGFISTNAIRFDSGSATLKPESGGILNEILMMLEEHGDLDLLIEGHTDSDGSDESNLTLSQQRAEAVAAWLIENGIDAGRLDTVGHGESQPVADNGTTEGKAENRRVVFRRR